MVHLLDQPLGMLHLVHLGHQTLGMVHVVHVLMLHILHLLHVLMLHIVHLRKQGLVMCRQDACCHHTNLLFHSPRPPTARTLSPPFRHGLLKVMSRRARRGVRA